jgi:hypothetical protein
MRHISDGAAQRTALIDVRPDNVRTAPHNRLAHHAQRATHDARAV